MNKIDNAKYYTVLSKNIVFIDKRNKLNVTNLNNETQCKFFKQNFDKIIDNGKNICVTKIGEDNQKLLFLLNI